MKDKIIKKSEMNDYKIKSKNGYKCKICGKIYCKKGIYPHIFQNHTKVGIEFKNEKIKHLNALTSERLKGKTYEEIYGKEKAKEIKNKLSKNSYMRRLKGKTHEEIYGKKKAERIKKKLSKCGKTYEEIYGKEKAKKIKKKQSNRLKGKTYEEIYGKEKAKKIKKKISKNGYSTGRASTPEKEELRKERISKAMKKVKSKPDAIIKGGRCK